MWRTVKNNGEILNYSLGYFNITYGPYSSLPFIGKTFGHLWSKASTVCHIYLKKLYILIYFSPNVVHDVYTKKTDFLQTSILSYHNLFLQPPIQVYGVEGRYATALFSAASKQKNLDKVEQELGRVAVSFPFDLHLRHCLFNTTCF